jgi:hypothetical protein
VSVEDDLFLSFNSLLCSGDLVGLRICNKDFFFFVGLGVSVSDCLWENLLEHCFRRKFSYNFKENYKPIFFKFDFVVSGSLLGKLFFNTMLDSFS